MLQSALAWLASPPEDPRRDLAPLRQHLAEVAEASIEPEQRLRLLDLFQKRIDATSIALKPGLLTATLPLPPKIRSVAQGLLDIHGFAASATLASLWDTAEEQFADPVGEIRGYCERTLRNLAEQQQVALLIATTAPNGLWTGVQDVVRLLRQLEGADTAGVETTLKGMLALSAMQPESFTSGEIGFLVGYLARYATAVELAQEPAPPLENWHWMEEGRDLPPTSLARRPPPNRGPLLYFSCATLSRIASQHLLQLSAGDFPENLPPLVADSGVRLEALARAQKYWAAAPLRHAHRKPTHYRVKIAAGFRDCWDLLRAEGGPDSSAGSPAITDWMVLNESPGGYALMHVSGPVAELVPGEMLSLRPGPDQPWGIGLIRWVRSDNPEHLELGLEMISPSAVPVQIVPTPTDAAELVPALLFPSVPGIDRDETLLTMRGGREAGSFILIRETDGKLQLTQCTIHQAALQTTKVELFEFRRDFSPE